MAIAIRPCQRLAALTGTTTLVSAEDEINVAAVAEGLADEDPNPYR